MYLPNKLKQYALGFLAAVFFVVIATNLVEYLHSGTVIISAPPSQSTIIVVGLNSNKHYGQGHGKLAIRLPAGSYVITAQGHVNTTNRIVFVKARQTIRYNFAPTKTILPEPITAAAASSLSADSAQLYYIDSSAQRLYRIDDQDNISTIGNNTSLTSVSWASPGYGVGQDTSGNLYLINGSSVTSLSLPPEFSPGRRVSFVATSDKKLFLSIDRDLYYGDISSNLAKIYSFGSTPAQLFASNGKVGVVFVSNKSGKSSISVLDGSGRSIASATNFVDGSYSWSNDGQYVAVDSSEGVGSLLNSSLHQIATLPNKATALAWLNSDMLFYATGNGLWSYSITTKTSSLVAQVDPGNSINQISVDGSASYAYLSITKQSGLSEVVRVGLNNQTRQKFVYQMDAFLPKTSRGCYLNFVNFGPPSILAETDKPSSVCSAAVEDEIINDGFSLDETKVNYTTALPLNATQN